MASSTDYFSNRPSIRPRPPTNPAIAAVGTPGTPRTPILNRSLSSAYGNSPGGSFRIEQEDSLVYELGARHFSAGFAGDSRPRCIHLFHPDDDRRVGDYRQYDPAYTPRRRKLRREEDWGNGYELYRTDLRTVDLGLLEDRLERVVRKVHIDYLQLDQKPRKAVLVLPSLLPTSVVEVALRVLFNHYAQPPSVALLTAPMLACVSAGVRDGLVVDIGWEETVVTAIGEYKEVAQRRSVRAGKMLTREMAKVLQVEVKDQLHDDSSDNDDTEVTFAYAEEATTRMGWCRSSISTQAPTSMTKLPSPSSDDSRHIHIPFSRLSQPAETTFFPPEEEYDDHDLPLATLAHRTLLSLPLDLRALCVSRILITGGPSKTPGLKHRILHEISSLIDTRGWDPVHSYGSATVKILQERSANVKTPTQTPRATDIPPSPAKTAIQDSIPHAARIHDDAHDPITKKVDAEMRKGQAEVMKGLVRGVETLGAWAGGSLVASLRVKATVEVEREGFLKGGLKEVVLI